MAPIAVDQMRLPALACRVVLVDSIVDEGEVRKSRTIVVLQTPGR